MSRLRMILFVLAMAGLLAIPAGSLAKEAAQQWELVNPEGVAKINTMQLAPRITSLEGKTIVLRWNGKPNGDILLERIAELLKEKVKDVKVIKSYETNPEINRITHNPDMGTEIAKKLGGMKPDIVIGAIAD